MRVDIGGVLAFVVGPTHSLTRSVKPMNEQLRGFLDRHPLAILPNESHDTGLNDS